MFIFVLFYFIVMPYRSVYFLLRDRKWVGLDGREIGEKLGGVEGGIEFICNKREIIRINKTNKSILDNYPLYKT